MSHHRETVTAAGAPAPRRSLQPRRPRRRPAVLLGPGRARPASRRARRRDRRRAGRAAACRTSRRSCAAPAARRWPTRCGCRLPHRHGRLREVNEVYGAFFPGDPPARVAIGVAALPKGAEVEIDAIVALPTAERRGRPRRRRAGAARPAVGDIVRRTPVLTARDAPSSPARPSLLKAENLQRTGSFKIRGALAKLAALGTGCARVVARQRRQPRPGARRRGAAARGVPCDVFVPHTRRSPRSRRPRRLGATVVRRRRVARDCIVAARGARRRGGLRFVHPFDDPDVVAGPGHARARAARGRARPRQGRRADRRRRARRAASRVAVKGARPEVRDRRRPGRGVRRVPGVPAPRRGRARRGRR